MRHLALLMALGIVLGLTACNGNPPVTGVSTTVSATASTVEPGPVGDSSAKIQSGGLTRTFLLHVPRSYDGSKSVPLVISYHGRGGTGSQQAQLTHLSDVADSQGFVVAYPDGINHAWNDGRTELNDLDPSVDDVGFTRDLISYVEARYKVDPNRIYATGFSRGGFMCYRLARDLPDLIAAIAPVSALLSQDLAGDFHSAVPVAALITIGTLDPLVPYAGGEVAGSLGLSRGVVLSAPDTARFFANLDGCAIPGTTQSLPDADPTDGADAVRTVYAGGHQGTEVQLYTITGGGHTWPGGLQYSPVSVAGHTCRDYDASTVIWQFFAAHPRSG